VKLVASYIPDGSTDAKLAYLEIRIEDRTCICPAKKDANTWLNFMCHNLGGEDIISSAQLITRAHHGDWYKFGAKNVSMKNIPDNDGKQDGSWDNANVHTGSNWPENKDANIGNPCPAGWRLPTITELGAVVNRNKNNGVISEINPLTNMPATNQTFSNLQSGDYLYLPVAGYRAYIDSRLNSRGYSGLYWSSTYDNYRYWNLYFNREERREVDSSDSKNGYSVRCVEAE
jgi:uncharacterized protein (TIGR02145 family)